MSKLTPFLLFDGDCAAAMTFYQACLGGELSLVKAGDSPMKAQFPESLHEKIINAKLTSGNIEIWASDWFHPTRTPKAGNMVCAYINDADYNVLKVYFDKLSQDASPELLDALQDMPFGAYGALTDKYGVRWMFQGSKRV